MTLIPTFSSSSSSLLLLVTFFLLLPNLTHSCGIVVHNEVSYRAVKLYQPKGDLGQKYKYWLTSFPGFMQAGSFFPDWGYQCLGYSQQSEDAHWAPFLKTAITYVRETYPPPYTTPHVQGLLVFLFATLSHNVADVRWHSLNGLQDYFVHVMAQLDFNGDYEEAHRVADTGAEFTLQHSTQLTYLNETWQIPIDDIVAIYDRYYQQQLQQTDAKAPLKEHLRYCMVAAYAGVKLDLKLGPYMFDYYSAKSPFLVDQLNDYYKGGLQDLSASVSRCFHDMAHSFDYGVPDILCGDYFDQNTTLNHSPRSWKSRENYNDSQTIEQLLSLNGISEKWDGQHGVLTLTSVTPLTAAEQHNQQSQQGSNQQSMYQYPFSLHPSQRYGNQQYGEENRIHDDEDDDQDNDLWQGHCQPFVITSNDVSGNGQVKDHEDSATLSVPSSLSGFGHATVIGDFDGDGKMDLAISAPYYSQEGDADADAATLTMAGAVFILDGATPPLYQGGNRDGMVPPVLSDARNASKTILHGKHEGGRFGWALAVVDFNQDGIDDLAVSTPFAHQGQVEIYFGGSGLASEPNVTLVPGTALFRATVIEGFGYTLEGWDVNQNGYRDLLVGCPFCTIKNLPQAGLVAVYTSKVVTEQQQGTPDHVFYSNRPTGYEHFGLSLLYMQATQGNGGTLLIGAPRAPVNNVPQVGKVYGFHLFDDSSSELRWIMSGKSKFGQFGSVLQGWKNDMIMISSPTEETKAGIRKYGQGGRIRLYDWHVLDRGQNKIPLDFGLVNQVKGRGHFGASVAFFEQDQQIGLWIGEPLGSKEKGRMYRWLLRDNHLDCLEKEAPLARFGARIIHLGSDVICITSQHDSHSARYSGAIDLYSF